MGLPLSMASARLHRLGMTGQRIKPIEQLTALLSIPGLIILRPADANEVFEAWRTIHPLKSLQPGLALQPACSATLDSKLATHPCLRCLSTARVWCSRMPSLLAMMWSSCVPVAKWASALRP